MGAGLLSLYVIWDWAGTCFENVTRLSGQAAETELQKKLMYLAYRFSPIVRGFKSITSYHAGDGVWVEIDVLLDENTTLHRSHDIAETIQYCTEALKEVDRAFVTTDCKFPFSFWGFHFWLEDDHANHGTDGDTDTSQGPTGHASDAERT